MADKKQENKDKKPAYRMHKVYTVEGDKITSKNRTCPKCGNGIFMAKHKDRWTCGKCGYMEKI
jgi:small subunit ribosomal protein S27Ae